MIRNYLLLTVVLLFPFLTMCSNKDREAINQSSKSVIDYMLSDLNRFYLEQKSKGDSSLTDHFPEILDTTNLKVSGTPIDRKDLFRMEVMNRFFIEGVEDRYGEKSIAAYVGDDPCVLTIEHIEGLKEKLSNYRFRECYINRYPVPNFSRNTYSDYSNKSRLSKDFTIYVLESKPANVSQDSLIINNELLLTRWEKGYSKGVAINNELQIIIYWTLAWE